MKTSILKIALFIVLALSGSLLAQADNEPFPSIGRIYNVSFTENSRQSGGQIKVIRKGEGSWIFVEYTMRVRQPRPRVVAPGSQATPPEDVTHEAEHTVTKKLWMNTYWMVTASEIEAEKE